MKAASHSLYKFFLSDNMALADARNLQRVIVISLVQIVAGVLFAPIYFLLGHRPGALFMLLGMLAMFVNLLAMKRFSNLRVSCLMPALLMFLVQFGLAYTQDGINSTSLPWFVTIPIIALFTCGIQASLLWGGLSALTILGFHVVSLLGVPLPPNPLTEYGMHLLTALGNSGLVMYLLGFAIANELQKKLLFEEIDKLAYQDTLTGIPNRRSFFEGAQKVFGIAREKALYAVILDIDRFKQVNDAYGHPAGDEVLVRISETIMRFIPAKDIFGRVGGEEFALIHFDVDDEGAGAFVEKIRVAVEETRIVLENGVQIQVTISSGMSRQHDAHKELDELLQEADEALYSAKEAGRNRVMFRMHATGG